MNTVLVTIGSDLTRLRTLRLRMRRWLAASEVPGSLHDSIVLGVHEAAASAIEHAPPSASVAIRASIERGVLTIDVTDAGGSSERGLLASDEGSHRVLLRRLFEHVEICPTDAGTTVRLRQPLD